MTALYWPPSLPAEQQLIMLQSNALMTTIHRRIMQLQHLLRRRRHCRCQGWGWAFGRRIPFRYIETGNARSAAAKAGRRVNMAIDGYNTHPTRYDGDQCDAADISQWRLVCGQQQTL